VVTKFEKQLAPQVDRPNPNAFVLPKFEILFMPGFEPNVPVVEIEILESSIPDSKSSDKMTLTLS
jgi:hypothetical protein